MSTLAATNLKHASSATNNIVLDTSGNTTVAVIAAGIGLWFGVVARLKGGSDEGK